MQLYAEAIDVGYIVRRAWIALGRPAMSEGSSGQAICHPLVGAIAAQEKHVASLAETLLLTPKSRASAQRSGWRRGQARSEDRDSPIRRLRTVETAS